MSNSEAMHLRAFIKKLDERIQELNSNPDTTNITDLELYDLGFLAMDANQGTIDSGTASKIFDIADRFDSSPRNESLDKLKEIGKEYDV